MSDIFDLLSSVSDRFKTFISNQQEILKINQEIRAILDDQKTILSTLQEIKENMATQSDVDRLGSDLEQIGIGIVNLTNVIQELKSKVANNPDLGPTVAKADAVLAALNQSISSAIDNPVTPATDQTQPNPTTITTSQPVTSDSPPDTTVTPPVVTSEPSETPVEPSSGSL